MNGNNLVISKEVKDKVLSKGLWMSRVPDQTRTEFKELAKAHFVEDYGMALKHLLDEYKKSNMFDLIAEKMMELENRVNSLESKEKVDKDKGIKTLSGRKIK